MSRSTAGATLRAAPADRGKEHQKRWKQRYEICKTWKNRPQGVSPLLGVHEQAVFEIKPAHPCFHNLVPPQTCIEGAEQDEKQFIAWECFRDARNPLLFQPIATTNSAWNDNADSSSGSIQSASLDFDSPPKQRPNDHDVAFSGRFFESTRKQAVIPLLNVRSADRVKRRARAKTRRKALQNVTSLVGASGSVFPAREFPVYETRAIDFQRVVPGKRGAINQFLLPLDRLREVLRFEIEPTPNSLERAVVPPATVSPDDSPHLAFGSLFLPQSCEETFIFAFTNQRKCPEMA